MSKNLNTKNKFFRRVLPLASLVAGLVALFLLFSPSNSHTDTKFTLLSHNVAGIQSNPIEYSSVFEGIANNANPDNQEMQAAATKIVNADKATATMDIDALLQTFINCAPDDIKSTLVTAQKALEKTGKKEGKQLDEFVKLHKKERLGNLDKYLRDHGKERYSVYFYDAQLIKDLKNPHWTLSEDYAKKWWHTVAPHLPKLSEKLKDQLSRQLLLTYLCDILGLKKLATQEKGLQAWANYTETLKDTIIGDPEKRKEALLKLYEKSGANILCLQEADQDLVTYLCKNGYSQVTSQGETAGSSILYRNSWELFNSSTINPISLTKEEIEKAKQDLADKGCDQNFAEKDEKKLTTEELMLHHIEHKGKHILITSYHAGSAGKETLLALQAIHNHKETLEKKLGQKILLFIGMDGNTTDKEDVPLPKKRKISTVDPLLEKLHIKRVKYKKAQNSNNIDTVNKTRSSFQLQLDKTHQPSKAISDMIIYNDPNNYDVVLREETLSDHGPNLSDNPSDHRALIATFHIKKTG